MTLGEYKSKIAEVLKIKLTNYRLTSNDIEYLVDFIYEDIGSKVILSFYKQAIVLDDTLDEYDLDAMYVSINNDVLLNCMGVQDKDGKDITKMFRDKGNNVFEQLSGEYDGCGTGCPTTPLNGDTVYFVRQQIKDIENLTSREQALLLPAIIEGCIYHTQDAIPNPTGSNSTVQETNYHFQRYFQATENLLNQLPQRI